MTKDLPVAVAIEINGFPPPACQISVERLECRRLIGSKLESHGDHRFACHGALPAGPGRGVPCVRGAVLGVSGAAAAPPLSDFGGDG